MFKWARLHFELVWSSSMKPHLKIDLPWQEKRRAASTGAGCYRWVDFWDEKHPPRRMSTIYQHFGKIDIMIRQIDPRPEIVPLKAIWWFLFGRLFGWPGSYDLLLNEYLKTQSWSGEWILDEERGARHCEDALSGLPSQHKRLCTQRSPKMTSFQEEEGYLSLFMEKETSVLCSSNNLATSPPSVKSSRNPPLSLYPPIIPSSTSSTTPHPNPSIPLVTSSRPDRHQRAGNIGILCHRFCSDRCLEKGTILDAI